jgi:hypothetical protein
MQCNVEFGYQLSICSGTKENHGKSWSNWPVGGPSECNWLLTSSPALNPRTLTLVPNLCYCIVFFFSVFSLFSFFFTTNLFSFYNYLYVHMIWISTRPYKTHMEGINTYVNKHAYKHTYICICFSSIIVTFGSLLLFGNRMFYEVCCSSNNKDYVTQLIHFTGLHFSFVSLVLSSFRYKKKTSHFTSLYLTSRLSAFWEPYGTSRSSPYLTGETLWLLQSPPG